MSMQRKHNLNNYLNSLLQDINFNYDDEIPIKNESNHDSGRINLIDDQGEDLDQMEIYSEFINPIKNIPSVCSTTLPTTNHNYHYSYKKIPNLNSLILENINNDKKINPDKNTKGNNSKISRSDISYNLNTFYIGTNTVMNTHNDVVSTKDSCHDLISEFSSKEPKNSTINTNKYKSQINHKSSTEKNESLFFNSVENKEQQESQDQGEERHNITDSMLISRLTNSISSVVKKKIPILLNNVHSMYDLNSERNKKRSEQMKKRKFNFMEVEMELGVNEIETFPPFMKKQQEQSNIKRKNSVNIKKTFKNEEKTSEAIIPENLYWNKSKSYSNTYLDDQTELVVSDLDCEIQEGDDDVFFNSKTNLNKLKSNLGSFIPLQNHLKSKRGISEDKSTDSYKMALYQYEDADSSINGSYSDNNKHENTITNIHGNTNQNTQINYKPNYIFKLPEVIEEETSENNTDNESSVRKKYSSNLKSIERENNNNNNTYFSSICNSKSNFKNNTPNKKHSYHQSAKSFSSSKLNNKTYDSFLNIVNDPTITSYRTDEKNYVSLRKNNNFHKNSKSDFINFHVDIKKIIENYEKRRLSEKEELLENIKKRKKFMLDKFLKSNSHHYLPYTNTPLDYSDQKLPHKKHSININPPNSLNFDNLFKKLSPSGVSRAFFYDYNFKDEINSEMSQQVLNNSVILENNQNNCIDFEEEIQNDENDDVEIIENKSIFEINDDEEINSENQSNIKIEKITDNLAEIEIEENYIFEFNSTPSNTERKKPIELFSTKLIFESEDMRISKGEKVNIIQDNVDDLDTDVKENTNIDNSQHSEDLSFMKHNFNEISHIKYNNSISISKNADIDIDKELKSSCKKNLKIIPNISIHIPSSVLSSGSASQDRMIFNNNYINKNINNISINIFHNNKWLSNNNKPKSPCKIKTPSYNINKSASNHRSYSFSIFNDVSSPNKSNKSQKSSLIKQQFTPPTKSIPYNFNDMNLKQFLIYSDSKLNKNNQDNSFTSLNVNTTSPLKLYNNSETSIRFSNNSNFFCNNSIQIINDALKVLKFQTSSIDHLKFTIEMLKNNKAKFFCLLISQDYSLSQNVYEYKALYELNLEKNNLNKIYSVNYCPGNIEFNEIKQFYTFDIDCKCFKNLTTLKKFIPEVHGFEMQYNYKKFLKG